jgi:hypothetical protein
MNLASAKTMNTPAMHFSQRSYRMQTRSQTASLVRTPASAAEKWLWPMLGEIFPLPFRNRLESSVVDLGDGTSFDGVSSEP